MVVAPAAQVLPIAGTAIMPHTMLMSCFRNNLKTKNIFMHHTSMFFYCFGQTFLKKQNSVPSFNKLIDFLQNLQCKFSKFDPFSLSF